MVKGYTHVFRIFFHTKWCYEKIYSCMVLVVEINSKMLEINVTLPSWVDIPLTNLVTTTIGPTGLVAYRSSVLLPTLSNCRL